MPAAAQDTTGAPTTEAATMAQAFAELEASGEGATLTHADWLGLLIDREITHRRDKRLAARVVKPPFVQPSTRE